VLAALLRREILDLRLPSGTRVGDESEIGAQSGFGRGVVREALRAVESDGLLAVRQGKTGGIFVRYPHAEHVARIMAIALEVEDCTVGEVFELRRMIEAEAARLAALRRTPEDIASLRAVQARTPDGADFVFHLEIARISRNRAFILVSQAIAQLMDPNAVRAPSGPIDLVDAIDADAAREVARAHLRIIDAIVAGDSEAAASRSAKHVLAWEGTVSDRLGSLDQAFVCFHEHGIRNREHQLEVSLFPSAAARGGAARTCPTRPTRTAWLARPMSASASGRGGREAHHQHVNREHDDRKGCSRRIEAATVPGS